MANKYAVSAFTSTIPEVVLASTATALCALMHYPDATSIAQVVGQLTEFLKEWTSVIRQLPYGMVSLDSATAPNAVRIICQNLLQLARKPACLPLDGGYCLHELIKCLREICVGPHYSHHKDASADLEAFMQTLVNRGRREIPGDELINLIAIELDALHAAVVSRHDFGNQELVPEIGPRSRVSVVSTDLVHADEYLIRSRGPRPIPTDSSRDTERFDRQPFSPIGCRIRHLCLRQSAQCIHMFPLVFALTYVEVASPCGMAKLHSIFINCDGFAKTLDHISM